MSEIICDYPKCTKPATNPNVEVESCDGSLAVTCNLCDQHNQESLDYGRECDDKEWEDVAAEAKQSRGRA